MTVRLTPAEVRERRARVLDEREAKAALFVQDPGISTLIGRVVEFGPPKPMAMNAATGFPAIATGAVTSAAEEPIRTTIALDVKTHQEKKPGPKK